MLVLIQRQRISEGKGGRFSVWKSDFTEVTTAWTSRGESQFLTYSNLSLWLSCVKAVLHSDGFSPSSASLYLFTMLTCTSFVHCRLCFSYSTCGNSATPWVSPCLWTPWRYSSDLYQPSLNYRCTPCVHCFIEHYLTLLTVKLYMIFMKQDLGSI